MGKYVTGTIRCSAECCDAFTDGPTPEKPPQSGWATLIIMPKHRDCLGENFGMLCPAHVAQVLRVLHPHMLFARDNGEKLYGTEDSNG